jgi:large conductance mechanosensitive channel
MGLISEFKTFAIRGNVIDLAVAVILGGAFGAIVTALVDKVLMPIVGFITGGNFATQTVTLIANIDPTKRVELGYGAVIQASINFLAVAFFVFLLVKALNRLQKKEEAAPAPPAEPTNEEKLLGEIRDLLRK